ncbi:MAG: hypothetical protein O3C40_29970 [Planctomycetota bacterium]|nr:hypothetical protein [Planctomycetota bacterium]
MNHLGKNLVLSLCVVATLLVILGLKRKFGADAARTLLSQPADDLPATAPASTKSAPQPRVLQSNPATGHDRELDSPTSPRYNGSGSEPMSVRRNPISPVPTVSPNPVTLPQSLDAPELVPVDEPITSPVTDSVGDEEPQATPSIETPTVPVARRPLPEFVLTGAKDSFWSISEQVYGSGVYYRALFRHNEARVLRPDQLQAGIEVTTPPLEVLRKRYPADFPAAPPAALSP